MRVLVVYILIFSACLVVWAELLKNADYYEQMAGEYARKGEYKLAQQKKAEEAKQFYEEYILLDSSRQTSLMAKIGRLGPSERVTNNLGMKFVYIKPGSFQMGSNDGGSNEKPVHKVTISKSFYLQTTEVTQGQWKAVMGNNPSYFKNAGADAPVEQVSWNDVQEFIRKLNARGEGTYRLPTEAEWEYACRAGTSTAIYTGDLTIVGTNNGPELDEIAWYGGNSGVNYSGAYDSSDWKNKQYNHMLAGTHPVGQKKDNGWGLYDMIGNVWEWCQDWYGPYSKSEVVDPTGPGSGVHRVFRGGGWGDFAKYCRSAFRDGHWPDIRNYYVGLRLVKEVE